MGNHALGPAASSFRLLRRRPRAASRSRTVVIPNVVPAVTSPEFPAQIGYHTASRRTIAEVVGVKVGAIRDVVRALVHGTSVESARRCGSGDSSVVISGVLSTFNPQGRQGHVVNRASSEAQHSKEHGKQGPTKRS